MDLSQSIVQNRRCHLAWFCNLIFNSPRILLKRNLKQLFFFIFEYYLLSKPTYFSERHIWLEQKYWYFSTNHNRCWRRLGGLERNSYSSMKRWRLLTHFYHYNCFFPIILRRIGALQWRLYCFYPSFYTSSFTLPKVRINQYWSTKKVDFEYV